MTKEIAQAFWSAYRNEHSRMYQHFYAERQFVPNGSFPKDLSDWERVPLFSKEKILEYPFNERLFIPLSEVLMIRTSSGTSKRGVTLIPRNRPYRHTHLIGNCTRVMDLFYPQHSWQEVLREAGIETIGGDPAELTATAQLAARLSIDGLCGSITLLLAFAPHLGVKLRAQIRVIRLADRFSPLQIESLEHLFPRALLVWDYAMSETQGMIGYPCDTLLRQKKDLVHPLSKDFYWELIDYKRDETILEEGVEGEIVLTSLWEHNPLPLIRFRTGDRARLISRSSCACGSEEGVYEILGRVTLDRISIAGGELRSEEVERIGLRYKEQIGTDFEVQVHEEKIEDGIVKERLVLAVGSVIEGSMLQQIASTFAQELRVGPTRTYQDGVERGLYLPMRGARIPPDQAAQIKMLRIRRIGN